MNVAVVVFPGSNCDRDCLRVCNDVLEWKAAPVWHRDALPAGLDLVILPGGFSHGDYLRTGALAALAPIMEDVRRYAGRGGRVLGICNGFQILCEAGLLPGVLRVNRDLEFHCEDVFLTVENTGSDFTVECGRLLRMPIAHREGNYHASPAELASLQEHDQILFRYCDRDGNVTDAANPNGSLLNIAGICNKQGNVCGMMPHPERACEALLGGVDGRGVFASLEEAVARGVGV